MRLRVDGADRDTGAESTWEVECQSVQEARQKANAAGFLVSSIQPVSVENRTQEQNVALGPEIPVEQPLNMSVNHLLGRSFANICSRWRSTPSKIKLTVAGIAAAIAIPLFAVELGLFLANHNEEASEHARISTLPPPDPRLEPNVGLDGAAPVPPTPTRAANVGSVDAPSPRPKIRLPGEAPTPNSVETGQRLLGQLDALHQRLAGAPNLDWKEWGDFARQFRLDLKQLQDALASSPKTYLTFAMGSAAGDLGDELSESHDRGKDYTDYENQYQKHIGWARDALKESGLANHPLSSAAKPDQRGIEKSLAIIQTGREVPDDDPAVVEFGRLLDNIHSKCPESRQLIGDMSAKAFDILTQRGVKTDLLSLMRDLDHSIPPDNKLRFAEIVAAYMVLAVNEK